MSYRFPACLGLLAIFLAAPLPGQAPAKVKKAIPHTADGRPDLQGTWTNATLTPMERPAEFAGKATVTDQEARAYEKKDLDTNDIDKPDAPLLARAGSAETGGYNNLFIDRGSELARVDGVKRTSLIIDPPDGKVPPLTEQARQPHGRGFDRYDSVTDRPLAERCLLGFWLDLRAAYAPGLVQQQLPDRADTGHRDDPDRDGA